MKHDHWLQVECQPPGMIQLMVTRYSLDHSNISLHFYDMAGSGSLQAVQIGHADEVLQLKPLYEHLVCSPLSCLLHAIWQPACFHCWHRKTCKADQVMRISAEPF